MAATKIGLPSKRGSQYVPLSRWTDSLSFAAATAESWVVPADINYVEISSTVPFYYNCDTTATVPGDVTTGVASPYVPSTIEGTVESGLTISFLPTAAGVITISCYSA